MNRTLTKITTLTGFVVLIGVFIYYRTGGFEQYMAPDNNAPAPGTTSNTTVPTSAESNTLVASALDNTLAISSADTTQPGPSDSAAMQDFQNLMRRRMMSSSKSIVVMEDNERTYKRFRKFLEKDSIQQARKLQDSLRKKLPYQKVGTPPAHQATTADTTKPRP